MVLSTLVRRHELEEDPMELVFGIISRETFFNLMVFGFGSESIMFREDKWLGG